ncbi:uncharacterized protein B0I36DRAFT_113256 [Microdochium trichocladiopsis]|uniref:CFEM domain-containing protein n=1 Tax=Microdochium trichocladiopsis TaxID=1682393 RepID=A0A9P9BQC3_9PEZI|nr:uncharacterized protein B0I36DRAFT_113256 [Microdochium trichocladiopsis]KAH7030725.1 hypothetical protein B0I36DRAFT_113256 [Microdochium trichocladiopsis]
MIIPLYAAIAGLLIGQVVSQAALSPCAAGCVDGVLADVSKMGCAVGDTACVCSYVGDVTNGVRDCVAQACAAEGAEQVTLAENSAKDRCAAVQAPPAPTTTPAPEAATTSPAEAATTSPAETASPSPASTEASSQSAPTTAATESTTTTAEPTSASAESTPTSSTTVETSSSASAETAASTSATATGTTSSATGSSGTAAQTGEAASQEHDETVGASGLSVAAKAGIGAGIGVALIMTAIVAICLTVRRKQQENEARRGNMIEISGPLPGGGRQWANEEGKYGSSAAAGGLRKSYSSELDRHARPYEEMVPHTQPRTMI